MADVVSSEKKPEIVADAQKVVDNNKQYKRGLITDQERYESS